MEKLLHNLQVVSCRSARFCIVTPALPIGEFTSRVHRHPWEARSVEGHDLPKLHMQNDAYPDALTSHPFQLAFLTRLKFESGADSRNYYKPC